MDLVIYFSATGTTKQEAEKLAKELDADLYEIMPVEPYTKADLDWTDPKSRSSVEMNNKDFKPPYIDNKLTLDKYDTIYLGFPIWWYVAPTIVNSFLENNDLDNKEIKLFATSGSSGFGNTVQELQPSAPNAKIEEWKLNGQPTFMP